MAAQVVERFCHFSKRRIDLFGVIDVVAIGGSSILGIQTTSGDNVSARLAKINAEPRALAWMKAGGSLEVHGWKQRGARGKRKLWTCRILRASVLPDGNKILWNETGTTT
jgi:hypothetical protein